jgi:hypothetical protein
MLNVYPYSGAVGSIEQLHIMNRISSLTRINTDLSGKEHNAVNPSLHTLEAHVQAVSTNRLRQALLAEQMRIANVQQPRSVGRIILALRASTGSWLITIGEKMSQQAAPRTRTTTA